MLGNLFSFVVVILCQENNFQTAPVNYKLGNDSRWAVALSTDGT